MDFSLNVGKLHWSYHPWIGSGRWHFSVPGFEANYYPRQKQGVPPRRFRLRVSRRVRDTIWLFFALALFYDAWLADHYPKHLTALGSVAILLAFILVWISW